MFQILRNYYIVGFIAGTDSIASAISATTLQNGDQLLWALTSRVFANIVGSTYVIVQN